MVADWIYYAAITDNVMLGEVENTFFKLAKKHGVQSSQTSLLNSLFSSVVDRLPTSLETFQRLKNSVAGDFAAAGCLWEDMALKHVACVEALQKITPRDHGETWTRRTAFFFKRWRQRDNRWQQRSWTILNTIFAHPW
jgi:hypothetical protein